MSRALRAYAQFRVSGPVAFPAEGVVTVLYSLETLQEITHIPHREQYDIWRSRLTDGQFDAICDELSRKIDSNEVHT